MNGGKKIGIVLAFVVLLAMLIFVNIGCASASVIYVPDDYVKIQWAVDNADTGDTIIVRDGTYTENVYVGKSLTIKSENGYDVTIVQASNPSPVFFVAADSINISGFTVEKSLNDGIYLALVNKCNISNNKASNNNYGIFLDHSNSNIIENNVAFNNHEEEGIRLYYSDNNILRNNTAYFNDDGICLTYSNNNALLNNNASYNEWSGIWLSHSFNNSIINNIANSNSQRWGIGVEHSFDNKIYLNNFINNSENVYSYNSTNIWNSTSKKTYTYKGKTFKNYLGNYWNDYTGNDIDEDRIADSSHSIDSDKDYYPLMESFENYFAPPVPITVPTLTLIGLAALIGLLSLIAISKIKRRDYD